MSLIVDLLVILQCQFDSSPHVAIEWLKGVDGRTRIEESDAQVIDLFTRLITSTIYESQLTVIDCLSFLLECDGVSSQFNPSESDFGEWIQCRAGYSPNEKHSIELRRAALPGKIQKLEVNPSLDSIELNFQMPMNTGELPLLRYIVKSEQIDQPDSLRTTSFPGRTSSMSTR